LIFFDIARAFIITNYNNNYYIICNSELELQVSKRLQAKLQAGLEPEAGSSFCVSLFITNFTYQVSAIHWLSDNSHKRVYMHKHKEITERTFNFKVYLKLDLNISQNQM
jgi:hypothetical protein